MISFKSGEAITDVIRRVTVDGLAKLNFVKDKKSKGKMKNEKGIHATKLSKEINVGIDADVFNSMAQYANDLERDKYLIISEAELISLESYHDL